MGILIYLMCSLWITATYQRDINIYMCQGYGWLHYAGQCYNLQMTVKKSWEEAQTFCSNIGANLVSLTSRDEVDFLNEQGIENVWIGLYKTGTNETWKWVDKSDVNLKLWDVGQPGSIGEDCGVAYSFDKWHDYPCFHRKSFVCKKTATTNHIVQSTTYMSRVTTNTRAVTAPRSELPTSTKTSTATLPSPTTTTKTSVATLPSPTTTTKTSKATLPSPAYTSISQSECPGLDWLKYGGKCYNLQTSNKTWQEAQTFCSNFNANLVSLTSKDEIDFLNKQGIKYVWIGLHKSGTNDTWKWVDKSDVNLKLWDVGQPGSIGEDCGVAYSFDKWHDYPCFHRKSFVCKKTATTNPIVRSTTSLSSATTNTRTVTTPRSELETTTKTSIATLPSPTTTIKTTTATKPSTVTTTKTSIAAQPRTTTTTKTSTSTKPSTATTTKTTTSILPSTATTIKSSTSKLPSTATTTKTSTSILPSTATTIKSSTSTLPSTATTTKISIAALPSTTTTTKTSIAAQPSTATNTKTSTSTLTSTATTIKSSIAAQPNTATTTKTSTSTLPSTATTIKSSTSTLSSTTTTSPRPATNISTMTTPSIQAAADLCPSADWVYFAGSCYYFDATERTWRKSQKICSRFGANLVILDSQEEIDFLNSKGFGYLWIGLHKPKFSDRWQWVDQSAMKLVRWDFDQPGRTGEDCGVAYSFDKWHDYSCQAEKKMLCEKVVSAVPIEQIPDVDVGVPTSNDVAGTTNNHLCPSTYWFYFAGSCYYKDENKRTWQESQDICSSFRADLVILNTQEEINFLNRQGLSYVWIGLYLQTYNDSWMWVDKTAMNLTRWDVDQPGRSGEDCVVAHTFDNWHDYSCSTKMNFVCERVVSPDSQATYVGLGIPTGRDVVTTINDRRFSH
ncbi:versican core protein-like [Physella acuta]|uniref:versican core protein-like n=1 Tax=Physella acuta TaxID=109671 RepID=UPI0027DD6436|nr:versican core protein-like [Physella acuta]